METRIRSKSVLLLWVFWAQFGLIGLALAAPALTSISPVSGLSGSSVTLSGSGFGAAKGASTVNFGSLVAATTSWSNTKITATVPALKDAVNVTVTVGGVTSAAKVFTFQPTVTSLSSASGSASDLITISGSSFGSAGTVKFGGVVAAVTSWTTTSITATVPAGKGVVNIVVTTAGNLASAPVAFTYKPAIKTLTPVSGTVGAVVTISGTDFGATAGFVKFGGASAGITSWSASSIKALVPAGTDSVPVSVTTSSALMSAPATFTYTPVITSLSAARGSAGDTLTVSGTSFGSVPGSVFLGTTSAAVSSWSSNAVSLMVPAGTGTVQVSLTTAGGLKSNAQPYMFLPALSSLTSLKIFANNNLGMHCVDKDFSVFSILPPFNTLNAQILGQDATGKPVMVYPEQVSLRYSAMTFLGTTATNSFSNGLGWGAGGKSNFWNYVTPLFGATLAPGVGLTGLMMPGETGASAANTQFSWNSSLGIFSAEGIPIFPYDDLNAPWGSPDPYPMLRVSAYDKTGNALLNAGAAVSTDVVVPVSDETSCGNCHSTSAPYNSASQQSGMTWSTSTNPDVQARTNVLLLHDARHSTNLVGTQPVLCAGCHYSPALDLAGTGPSTGQKTHKLMSAVMHDYHATRVTPGPVNGKTTYDAAAPIQGLVTGLNPAGIPPADQQSCYQCHPGANTKCLRGAMTDTVTCQNCHGGMAAVGGATPLLSYGPVNLRASSMNRMPWADEPRCQSCHTGDATNHLDAVANNTNLAPDMIRFTQAYSSADSSASPFLATNTRFAETTGQLFRNSKGHGGVACEGCHGSTHAIWPSDSSHPRDDIAPTQLQGHAGTIAECTTCHGAAQISATTQVGPHGMHVVNDPRWWNGGHGDTAHKENAKGGGTCSACHGADHLGTVLSRASSARSFMVEGRARNVTKGGVVSCDLCHTVTKSFAQ